MKYKTVKTGDLLTNPYDTGVYAVQYFDDGEYSLATYDAGKDMWADLNNSCRKPNPLYWVQLPN